MVYKSQRYLKPPCIPFHHKSKVLATSGVARSANCLNFHAVKTFFGTLYRIRTRTLLSEKQVP